MLLAQSVHEAPEAGAPWVGEGRAAAEQGLAQAVGGDGNRGGLWAGSGTWTHLPKLSQSLF